MQEDEDHKRKAREFVTEDRSLAAPILKRLVSMRVINLLPTRYSANALTLSGGACALAVAVSLWIAPQEIRQETPLGQTLLIASSFLILAYAVFDQLDGMQARRLGTSGPFGDFLDHWVDTTLANLIPVPAMILLGVAHPLILLMALWTALAFWAANWEVREVNRRILPYVGGLESILIGIGLWTGTVIFGPGVWQHEVAGVKLLTVIYGVCLIPLVIVVLHATRTSGVGKLGELFGFLLTLTPLSAWILWRLTEASEPIIYNLAFISLGVTATLMTGDLMRQHWMETGYRKINIWLMVPGLALLAAAAVSGQPGLSFPEMALVGMTAALAVIWLTWQGIDTFRRLTQ